jgi:3-mercaptopropionate dioxygenase
VTAVCHPEAILFDRPFDVNTNTKLQKQATLHLFPGQVTAVSPQIGDIHRVENALSGRPSISIHAYGANIGAIARCVFVPETGETKPFVSGHANNTLPNLWDRSAEARARLGI